MPMNKFNIIHHSHHSARRRDLAVELNRVADVNWIVCQRNATQRTVLCSGLYPYTVPNGPSEK